MQRRLPSRSRRRFGAIDIVVSPAIGGIVPGYETARHLGAKAIFVEREPGGPFTLRSGFSIPAGARAVIVEDIVTTGLSARECLASLSGEAGEVVGAACLIDRSGGRGDIGLPLASLVTLDIPAYPADALPPELAALPAVKPGSRHDIGEVMEFRHRHPRRQEYDDRPTPKTIPGRSSTTCSNNTKKKYLLLFCIQLTVR